MKSKTKHPKDKERMDRKQRLEFEAWRRGLPEGQTFAGRLVAAIREDLFAKQREVFDSGSKRVVASCGRRAGKTTLCVAKLLAEAVLFPDALCLYLGFSFQDAKETVWEGLIELVERLQGRLGVDLLRKEPLESTGNIHLANGSTIRLGGVSTAKEARKVLGKGKHGYRLIVLDELQDWQEPVIRRTFLKLEPALLDTKGSCWMVGTPGMVRRGFYWEARSGKGWAPFCWTMFDNPFMRENAEDWIRRDAEESGRDPQDPSFRREYHGEWVEDERGRAYQFTEPLNIYDGLLESTMRSSTGELVPVKWRYVLGVDFGKVDADALVVLAYSNLSHDIREVYAFKKRGQDITDLAEQIKKVQRLFPGVHIVADHAAKDILELRNRHGISIDNAEKKDKLVGRRWLNADLRRGHFKVRHDSDLLDEWRELLVDAEGEEVEPAENHLSDACLYAYRACRHFRPKEPKALQAVPVGPAAEVDRWLKERELRLAREGAKRQRREQRALRARGHSPWGSTGRHGW